MLILEVEIILTWKCSTKGDFVASSGAVLPPHLSLRLPFPSSHLITECATIPSFAEISTRAFKSYTKKDTKVRKKMKTYVLAVPSKTMEEFNWIPPLNNYLMSIYGKDHDYEQDLAGFNKLRQDIKGVNADKTGIKIYFKYYSQLELLDLRVPVGRLTGKKSSFVWYDAFLKSISHKQHSLPFEKANVLFNMASILTKAARNKYDESQRSNSNNEAEDYTKETLQLLQQAAGIYEFISENFLHAPSDDLSQSTLRFLKKLMLAQAQEIFVLKAISGDLEQKKNSLISKLCMSTSNHYQECAKMIDIHNARESNSTSDFSIVDDADDDEDDELEGIVDPQYNPTANESKITVKLDSSWTALINFKQTYYKSLAYYFNGLHLESSRKYGDSIAYITKASDILNEISSVTLKQISKAGNESALEVLDNYKYHKDALAIKLADLNKDNDLIYHEIVPSLTTLPEIKPLDSAKSIPLNKIDLFNEINEHNYENFLKNVVPIDIHELLSYYSEEKSQFLRNELDMVDVSNEELASVLEYLKLPKAIINLKEMINEGSSYKGSESSTIDGQTVQKVNEIASNFSTDSANKEKIVSVRKRIYSVISEIESEMNKKMSSAYKEEVIKLKKSLYDATTSDEKLFGLIGIDNNQLYNILSKGSNSKEFKSLFESDTGNGSKSADNEISLLDMDIPKSSNDIFEDRIKSIEEILYDLNVIKANKQKLVDTLKTEIHNDDISDILILNSKIKTSNEIKNVIFPEELKKFDPYAQELDKLLEKQKLFINNLREQWETLTSNPKVKEIQSSKVFKDTLMKDQITRINQFYNDHWKKYTVGLKRGGEFYDQLLNYAMSVRDKVMNEQSSDNFSDRFANMNLSAHSTGTQYHQAPPGVPPQNFQGYQQNQYFQQPMLNRSLTSSSSGIPSYDRPAPMIPGQGSGPAPPGLPPKFPTNQPQSYQPQHIHQNCQPNYQQSQQYKTPYQPPNPQAGQQQYSPGTPPGVPFNPNASRNQSNLDLIYDQPSTYNPDMYNFFSKD